MTNNDCRYDGCQNTGEHIKNERSYEPNFLSGKLAHGEIYPLLLKRQFCIASHRWTALQPVYFHSAKLFAIRK